MRDRWRHPPDFSSSDSDKDKELEVSRAGRQRHVVDAAYQRVFRHMRLVDGAIRVDRDPVHRRVEQHLRAGSALVHAVAHEKVDGAGFEH